jgi:adenylate cyclase
MHQNSSLSIDDPGLSPDELEWRREKRSAWFRVVVFLVLVINLHAGSIGDFALFHSHLAQAHIVAGYAIATLSALSLAYSRVGIAWLAPSFAIVDAALVVALVHEHLWAPGGNLDHSLTAPVVAIAFLLLAHAALRLSPRLVVLYAGLVLAGWLVLLGVMVLPAVSGLNGHRHDISVFVAEAALAAAFAFAAFVCHRLARDHGALLRSAVASERSKSILVRFFSPSVAAEIEKAGTSLVLSRGLSTVMFVDLRGFTRLSETRPPEEIANLLSEYRQLVTGRVFEEGGTVDKFIGDAVMAVFGHPHSKPDDAARAFRCALNVAIDLRRWRERRRVAGETVLSAGIGLHSGNVIGGVIESGCHDEFTVLGDAVNVAQRLESLSKTFDAALVVSEAALAGSPALAAEQGWAWRDSVELSGREGHLRVAVLPHDAPLLSAELNEVPRGPIASPRSE